MKRKMLLNRHSRESLESRNVESLKNARALFFTGITPLTKVSIIILYINNHPVS